MRTEDFLKRSNYIPSKISKGKIEIIGRNGKMICSLDVSDFKSKTDAKEMAENISILLHINSQKKIL